MTTEKTKEFQESRDGCAERERTAAALLAALFNAYPPPAAAQMTEFIKTRVALSVEITDALRAALRGAP